MRRIAMGFVFILLVASAARADQILVGSPSSGYGAYQTGNGGEFTLTPINPAGWLDLTHYGTNSRDVDVAGSFQTFCVEGGEYIYPYNSVNYAVIQQNAVGGGIGPSGDPISVGTGWLYGQFASNNWVSGLSYDYSGSGRNADADLLQKAIWWLEGEEAISYAASNKFMAAVVSQFGTQLDAQADGGWLYGVYALHLTAETGGPVQDQVYYGGTPVPEPTSLLLLGTGLGAIGLAAWRRRK